MPGRVPASLIVTVVLSLLVAAGALVGAGALRLYAARTAQTAPTGGASANPIGPSGCLQDGCRVLATDTVGGTGIELVAEADAQAGRLRIGRANSNWVIPATVTENGVTLTKDSLQCLPGGPAACLIRGRGSDNRVFGQIVVGRADSWASGQTYVSNAGYLALANVDGDSAPEVLAAQHDCAGGCAGGPVRVQVFDLNGSVAGCTRNYASVERLPGFPDVKLTSADLAKC